MSAVQTVIYKPHEHADEYMVFVEDVKEYEQWKEDKSIAMSRFMGPFHIYKTGTGHTGNMGEVSKQEIESAFFGDEKSIKDKSAEAAIRIILEQGHLHKGDMALTSKLTKNPARGAGDSKGGFAHR